jgi:outer membrane protein assembly factor BamE (lipoprotein component of BamABCDE complex)
MLAKPGYLPLGRSSKFIGSNSMRKSAILAGCLLVLPLSACLTPARDYHGYIPDEVQPFDIKPGEDTRSSVSAQLGSPSTDGLFDANTWYYVSDVQERFAFYNPKIADRSITAIRFGADDKVDEVLRYTAADGQVISYAARETATRGRELGLWEQIFGTVGSVRLPNTDEATPGNPTGRQGQ